MTQRFTIATIAGEAGRATAELFQVWSASQAKAGPNAILGVVDSFGEHLKANAANLPVVYLCEWIDHWLMGDAVPNLLQGKRFEAACMTTAEALVLAERSGEQFPENVWLAVQLRQAAESWKELIGPSAVVILREVLGATSLDEEVEASLVGIPDWLARLGAKAP